MALQTVFGSIADWLPIHSGRPRGIKSLVRSMCYEFVHYSRLKPVFADKKWLCTSPNFASCCISILPQRPPYIPLISYFVLAIKNAEKWPVMMLDHGFEIRRWIGRTRNRGADLGAINKLSTTCQITNSWIINTVDASSVAETL